MQFFSDTALHAFSRYEYAVAAVNGAGSGISMYSGVLTLPSVPESMEPPTARTDTARLDIIYLTWSPPEEPNGEYQTTSY